MITEISSPANPVFKSLKSLVDKKARREQGLFLAEGLRVCTEALATGHVPHTLIFAADTEDHPLTEALITATAARRGTIIRASRDLLHRLTGKDNPGAVAAAYPIPDTGLSTINRSTARLWVVAENLKDPGNLGTMLRTCDAVGAGGIILIGQSCDPFSLEAVRASMGGLFTRRVAQTSWAGFLPWLRSAPGQLVGAALDGRVVDYRAHRFIAPTFLFMGNEQSGLPAEYAAACDALVKLPMQGTADSLNVAVATAVLLYAALAQFEPLQ
ncbi:MAG: RNA methyltransferase [Sandarakinorhabdus sp.]|nr:RNA methyltransferase [Sandarakinorhabdus sp.]